jgi:hypothetical protein
MKILDNGQTTGKRLAKRERREVQEGEKNIYKRAITCVYIIPHTQNNNPVHMDNNPVRTG